MSDYRQKLNSMGVEIPSILLPQNIDLQKWAVIACDQYTQDRDYWESIKTFAGGAPSTLDMIFPEVFLDDIDAETRITDIHSNMTRCLKDGIFRQPKQGFIYIERDTPFQKKRKGLIAALDMEKYDWKPGSRPLVRSTEGTVADRLPPRMNIRRGAPLEVPHILILIDDDTDSLLPALGDRAKKSAPVYNTPLMQDSGNVAGWFLDAEEDMAFIAEKLDGLYQRSVSRYAGAPDEQPFLFAVGDGNHSLAAAKGIWEEYKKSHSGKSLPDHPCRYALVEIENIYDNAIQFEPIHRLVIGAGFDETMSILSGLPDFSSHPVHDSAELTGLLCNLQKEKPDMNFYGVASKDRYALVRTSASGIATACLQPFLDSAMLSRIADRPFHIDYIHEEGELFRLAAAPNRLSAGILLPPVQKSGLFETVTKLGPLPRKSFSMGHAVEKRFYMECRGLF